MCHLQLPPKATADDESESKKRKLEAAAASTAETTTDTATEKEGSAESSWKGVTLIPYLRFNDSCREMMTFYKGILGGQYEAKVSNRLYTSCFTIANCPA